MSIISWNEYLMMCGILAVQSYDMCNIFTCAIYESSMKRYHSGPYGSFPRPSKDPIYKLRLDRHFNIRMNLLSDHLPPQNFSSKVCVQKNRH